MRGMTTTHHLHAYSERPNTGGRQLPLIGIVAGLTIAGSAVLSPGASFASRTSTPAPYSAQVRAWRPQSLLLDGTAFEQAVADAIASIANGAALLDGAAFDAAVADALEASGT